MSPNPKPPGGEMSAAVRLPVSNETILVVDDEAQVRTLTSLILRRAGYEILVAPDGQEALAISRSYAGTIHLLLSDIEMPGINGIVLAGQLVQERPSIAVLLHSGNGAYAQETQFPFLLKPFSPESLRIAVARAMETAPAAPTLVNAQMAVPANSREAATVGQSEAAAPVQRLPWRFPARGPLWAAAAAMAFVVIPAGVYQLRQQRSGTQYTINLEARRGMLDQVETHRSLILSMDVSSLPRFPSYRVDLVDAAGHAIWQKAVPVQGTTLRVPAERLSPGVYFARVSAPTGELLREYGFILRQGWKHLPFGHGVPL
jgi:CheY-like chemotaxis protein